VVDSAGRKLGEKTFTATDDGHMKVLKWVRATFGADVVWGVEDCRPLSRRLETVLLGGEQRVVRGNLLDMHQSVA
jgi:transposase